MAMHSLLARYGTFAATHAWPAGSTSGCPDKRMRNLTIEG
jgi:hypothetical protein